MNVKFLKATLAVVCMVAAGTESWKAYSAYNCKQSKMDFLLLENVEALSSAADIGTRYYTCAKKISSNEYYGKSYTQRYCGDCKEHSVTKDWGTDNCTL